MWAGFHISKMKRVHKYIIWLQKLLEILVAVNGRQNIVSIISIEIVWWEKEQKMMNSLTAQYCFLKFSCINHNEKTEAKASPYNKISDSNTIEHKFILRSLEDFMTQRKILHSEKWSSDLALLMNSSWRTFKNVNNSLLTVWLIWVWFFVCLFLWGWGVFVRSPPLAIVLLSCLWVARSLSAPEFLSVISRKAEARL